MSFMEKLKKASKGVVDAGAKQMLKADIALLDREIKNRKQSFGTEIYDLMESLETNKEISVSEKESKIRAAFDAARKDIAVIRAKKDCKNEEMTLIDTQSGTTAATTSNIPPASGTVLSNAGPK